MLAPNIFRMENVRGLGPFNGAQPHDLAGMARALGWLKVVDGEAHTVGHKNAYEHRTHPHHMNDVPGANLGSDDAGTFLMLFGSPWRVGCKDIQQFYHWFPISSLPWFAHHGFHLTEYEAPRSAIRMGTWQLMFDISRARLIRRESLIELGKEAA